MLNALVVAGITALAALTPTRAVTGVVFCAPRALTLARELAVADGLLTTLLVRATREVVVRALFADVRAEDAIARVAVLVREEPEFVAADTARDADVERFMVLRCATAFC